MAGEEAFDINAYRKHFQLFQGMVLQPAAAVSGAVEHFVMHDNDFTVFGELDIQFNAVSNSFFCYLLESKHSIFRIIAAEAAVRKNLNHFYSSLKFSIMFNTILA